MIHSRRIRNAMAGFGMTLVAALSVSGQMQSHLLPRTVEEFAQRSRLPEVDRAPHEPVAATGAFIDAGRGPIPVHVPASYDPAVPAPLVILLHGYTNTGEEQEAYMQFAPLVDDYGFLYLYPTGTTDFVGNPFWNATDACCDLFGSGVDDSGYLLDVIGQMQGQYNVDPRRIYFIGHSNGGFMSYRMACDHAETVAAIASLAGATFLDPSDCAPAAPVHTLQIHGTSDAVIGYDGGCIPLGGCYPGAVETTEQWASFNACDPDGDPSPPDLDLVATIEGAETEVLRFDLDCAAGGSAELWSMAGAGHSPVLTSAFRVLVIEYLLAHPRPSPCPADFDGSGDVGFADLLAILASWGVCSRCPQDLDGDGVVGFGDLLEVLAAWGECL